jgi:hypothetical protein
VFAIEIGHRECDFVYKMYQSLQFSFSDSECHLGESGFRLRNICIKTVRVTTYYIGTSKLLRRYIYASLSRSNFQYDECWHGLILHTYSITFI